jgi:hypothetical protein
MRPGLRACWQAELDAGRDIQEAAALRLRFDCDGHPIGLSGDVSQSFIGCAMRVIRAARLAGPDGGSSLPVSGLNCPHGEQCL